MNYKIFILIFLFMYSCTTNNINKSQKKIVIETEIYSNKGFALLFTEDLKKNKIVSKKIDNRALIIYQMNLKKNTKVKITNLLNNKSILATVGAKAEYPAFFNSVLSKRIYEELDSFFWGFLGTIYFQYISFIGFFEVVVHRSIWTLVILIITTTILKKWKLFKIILFDKKKLLILFISGLLILGNWTLWIYAVSTDKIIDSSFGYFIFPIISVLLGFLFLNERLNNQRIISISLVIISTVYLIFKMTSFPWVGLGVALLWSTYNLLRKKINVETDIGLLIESLFILPIILFILYFIIVTNNNDFNLYNLNLATLIILAGPMTLIPLFLYVKGVELAGLGASGMVFFIVPTGQFLLGFFYFNEPFSTDKFISFIFIWIAVIIYLRDLYENN